MCIFICVCICICVFICMCVCACTARAMGHEISGANSYFRCAIPGLHLALQALIDYKGNLKFVVFTLMLNRRHICTRVECVAVNQNLVTIM